MFDAAFAVLVAVAILRARRAGHLLAASLGLAVLVGFLVVDVLALGVDQASWGLAGVLGLAIVGPSAILQARSGLAGALTNPALGSAAFAVAATVAAVACARRARDIYPEHPEARTLHRAEVAFVGVGCFAATRLVTALLAFALLRD